MKRTEEEKQKKSQERIDAKKAREERRSKTAVGRAVNEDLREVGLDSTAAQKRHDEKFGVSNPVDKTPSEPVIPTGNPGEGDGGTAKIGDKNFSKGGATEISERPDSNDANALPAPAPQEGNGSTPASVEPAPAPAPEGGAENLAPVEGAAPQGGVQTPPEGNGITKPNVEIPDVPNGGEQEESVTGKNSASNSATNSKTTSTENGTIEKKRVLNDLGREAQERYDARIAEKQAEVADARSSYAVKTPEQARQEVMEDPAFKDKSQKKIDKEVKKRVAASRDEVYRMLDPNYKTEKQVKRNELAKLLIGGFADLFSTGMAAGAAFNGVRYPLKSMTAGIQADIDEKDAQRRALTAALEKMRQGKIDLPQKELTDLMNGKDKALQNPAYYNEVQEINKTRGSETDSLTQTAGSEYGKTVKDPKEGGGKKEGNGYKTANNEFEVHVPGQKYTYLMTTGASKTFLDEVFDRFKKVSGVKLENGVPVGGNKEAKDIGNMWALLLDVRQSIQGTDDANAKAKYQLLLSDYLTRIYKYFSSNTGAEDRDELYSFIDNYVNASGVRKFDERNYDKEDDGQDGGQSGKYSSLI